MVAHSIPQSSGSEMWGDVVMDLGKSVVIKGELSASEDLTLYGHVEGTITLPGHTLSIESNASISASISAKIVVIMGAVTGKVTAGERIDIRATGSVTGDIASPRLIVADEASSGAKSRCRLRAPLWPSEITLGFLRRGVPRIL